MGGRQITWIFAIYFVGLDCFEPNSGGFMMVLRFSAEEMLQLLRTGKIISGCLGGGHISGWWKLSWVPSSKFPSAFICKTFSQSACFPAVQVWLPEVSFCLSSHLCSFLFADHFVPLKIPELVGDFIGICHLNAKCERTQNRNTYSTISTAWLNGWKISMFDDQELLMRVHPPEMRQQVALEDRLKLHLNIHRLDISWHFLNLSIGPKLYCGINSCGHFCPSSIWAYPRNSWGIP